MKKMLLTVALSGMVLGCAGMAPALTLDDWKGADFSSATVAAIQASSPSSGFINPWDSYGYNAAGTKVTGLTNGEDNRFDIYGYTVTANSTSNVVITLYAKQNTYFDKGIYEWGLGDLFISVEGGEAYDAKGVDWEKVVYLGYPLATNSLTSIGDSTLYSAESGRIINGAYRDIAAYNSTGQTGGVDIGGWVIDPSGNPYDTLTFTLNLSSFWNGSTSLLMQFAATCGNDIVRMEVNAVPEPTTLLLFGTGLVSLAAIGRRRRQA